MKTIRELATDLLHDAESHMDGDPAFAAEILDIAEKAFGYADTFDKHAAILEGARQRVAAGEDGAAVFRSASNELLATWPDALAYGTALDMLAEICGGIP